MMRKNSVNRKAAKERLNNENERVLHRIKQRESKRKYCAKKKKLNELTNEVSFSTLQKQVIKNKRRKLQQKYQENSTISNSSIVTPESSTPNTNTQQAIEVASPMLVSSSLCGCLSPSTKKKVKSKPENEELPIGMNTQIRKELVINLFINVRENKNSPIVLQKSIEDFFLSDDVTRVCPETKKVKKTQNDPDEEMPLCCCILSLRSLHEKFVAENLHDCSYLYFNRHCPYYVEKPSPND